MATTALAPKEPYDISFFEVLMFLGLSRLDITAP